MARLNYTPRRVARLIYTPTQAQVSRATFGQRTELMPGEWLRGTATEDGMQWEVVTRTFNICDELAGLDFADLDRIPFDHPWNDDATDADPADAWPLLGPDDWPDSSDIEQMRAEAARADWPF